MLKIVFVSCSSSNECGAACAWFRRDKKRIAEFKPRPNNNGCLCWRNEEQWQSDCCESGSTSSKYSS